MRGFPGRRSAGLVVASCLLAVACGDEEEGEGGFSDGVCEANEPASFVKQISQAWYLYPSQLPDLPPPEGDAGPFLRTLVEDVDLAPDSETVRAEDRFSYVTTVASYNQSRTGDFVGIGITYRLEGEVGSRFLRLKDVFGAGPREDPTPASEGGLQRGDKILEVNGRTIEAIIAERAPEVSELFAVSEAFGPGAEGEVVALALERPDGGAYSASLVRRPIQQNEVSHAEVLEVEGLTIGYLMFRAFTPTAPDELASAIGLFEEAGISHLVIDLRYNGGGLVDVAWYFANLLVGPAANGELFLRGVFNPQQTDNTYERSFRRNPACPVSECAVEARPLSTLEELVFITTGQTASASEMLINGLQPILPVRIVGSRSFGKPVGSYAFEHEDCDQVYAPVTLKTVNATGDGDFFDGFEVDCPAADDATRRFGDPEEASLAAAIALIRSGTCPIRSGFRLDADVSPLPIRRGETYGELLSRSAPQ